MASAIRSWHASLYFIFFIATLLLQINVPTLFPLFYQTIFKATKQYLEELVSPAPLTIKVYEAVDWIVFFNYFLLFMAIVIALLSHHASLTTSIKNALYQLYRLSLQAILLTTTFVSIFLLITVPYFAVKLSAVSQEQGPKAPFALKPVTYLFKATGSYESAKTYWAKLFQLPKAQQLFAHINTMSYHAWYLCNVLSLLCTIIFIVVLIMRLKSMESYKE